MKIGLGIALVGLLALLSGWFFGYQSGTDRPAQLVSVPDPDFCQDKETQELCYLRCLVYILNFTMSDLGTPLGRVQYERLSEHCAAECTAEWMEVEQ